MTESQNRGRISLLFAFAAILTFMGAMGWLRYRHGMPYWTTAIGFSALVIVCWQVWRGWQPAYVMLCAATGLGALASFVVAHRLDLAVFAIGMNGFAFINLVLPVTRAFIAEQSRIRLRQSDGLG